MDSVTKKWLIRFVMLLLLLASGWFVYLLWPVIKPLLGGVWLAAVPLFFSVLLAYLLLPFIHLLIKAKCSNRLAVWIVFIVLFGLLGALVQWGVPALIKEWRHFMQHLPTLTEQFSDWNHMVNGWLSQMPAPLREMIIESIERFSYKLEKRVENAMGGLDGSFKWIIALSLTPFMAFYLVKDRLIIGRVFMRFVPARRKKQALEFSHELDQRLGGYIRGQLWLSLSVAVLSFVALFLINIPYAFPLAGIMGIFNVIPYIGPVIGSLPAVLVASTISGNMIVWVIVVAFVIQMVESHLLSPWILGNSVHIHPVMIMILLLIGGEIAGMAGLILVVPLYMVASIVIHVFLVEPRQQRIDK